MRSRSPRPAPRQPLSGVIPVRMANVERYGPGDEAKEFVPRDFILTHRHHLIAGLISLAQRRRFRGADAVYAHWSHAALIVEPPARTGKSRPQTIWSFVTGLAGRAFGACRRGCVPLVNVCGCLSTRLEWSGWRRWARTWLATSPRTV
jgi:hypothetical protein